MLIVCLEAAGILHLDIQGNFWITAVPDPRNSKVELQKKTELSLGAMLYNGYFLNHIQPTNDHDDGFVHNVLLR